MSKTIQNLSRLVLIQHSVFALPFTLASFLLALRLGPLIQRHSIVILGFLAVCCAVSARSAAMGFNRVVDLKYDRENPRTERRELVTGSVTKFSAVLLVAASSSAFILFSFLIGSHCGVLSPLVLIFLFFYSLTKRFTSYSHLVLGAALGMAPGGAWWILRPQVEIVPLMLMAAVTFWVGGFDIIYACQDLDFDRASNLHSVPAKLGIPKALRLSRAFHLAALVLLTGVGLKLGLGLIYLIGMLPIGAMFIYQHYLVRNQDLSLLNRAFFTVNGYVAVYYLLLVVVVYS